MPAATACGQHKDANVAFGPAVNHPRRLDAAERFEAGALKIFGMSLRLGLGRGVLLLPLRETITCIRPQRILVTLERDRVVTAFLDDGLDHPPVAMQRIGSDNLALEIDQTDHKGSLGRARLLVTGVAEVARPEHLATATPSDARPHRQSH